ncbi:unnamed protein product [marine sediment metagenome]|uniref:Uncharacterized protein n=1 Tax=marine sediment metagenome TaxID=412755 RepID=X0WWN9_9ZZZZ
MTNKCGICGGINDIGEMCEKCSEDNPELTYKHMLDNYQSKDIQKGTRERE